MKGSSNLLICEFKKIRVTKILKMCETTLMMSQPLLGYTYRLESLLIIVTIICVLINCLQKQTRPFPCYIQAA